jgi:hypothetical protein
MLKLNFTGIFLSSVLILPFNSPPSGSLSFAGSHEKYFCSVEVSYNSEETVEEGFITSYLEDKITDILLELGWKRDCSKGKNVKVDISSVDYEGSSISGNRFSGYKVFIDFSISIGNKTLTYSWSKYFSLPEPSLGTLKIRSTIVDLLESHELELKQDILENF